MDEVIEREHNGKMRGGERAADSSRWVTPLDLRGRLLSIHHFAFTVTNLDRTLDFYIGLLGFELRSRSWHNGPGLAEAIFGSNWQLSSEELRFEVARLELNGINVHFHQYYKPTGESCCPVNPSAVGSAHFAVQVKDIELERARLERAGVPFHAAADWFNESGQRPWRWCYLRDPDGLIVELVEEVPADVQLKMMADRIREVRLARNLTLQQVAEMSGTSPAHLSQIERGRSVPSVGVLLDISHALTLPPDYFLRVQEQGFRNQVGRGSQRKGSSVSDSPAVSGVASNFDVGESSRGLVWEELATGGASGSVMRLTCDVGASGDESNMGIEGEECGTVLQGTLLVELDDSKHILEAGSSITYDRRALRRIANAGQVPAVAVWSILGKNCPSS